MEKKERENCLAGALEEELFTELANHTPLQIASPELAGGFPHTHEEQHEPFRLLQQSYSFLLVLLIERFFFPQACEHSLLKPNAEK